jgi:hypothetical protein
MLVDRRLVVVEHRQPQRAVDQQAADTEGHQGRQPAGE